MASKTLPIADAVVFQLFRELGLQFVIGNAGAAYLNLVAYGGHAFGVQHSPSGVGLVLVEVNCSGESSDAVVDADLHIAKLLLVQSRRQRRGCEVRFLRLCARARRQSRRS